MSRNVLDRQNNIIAQVYNLNAADKTIFPSPEDKTFQFGVGVIETDKVYKTHIHKRAERVIQTTSEFLYVISGLMIVNILDEEGHSLETIHLKDSMGLLQFYGGHGIEVKKGTKYFELKQGPYYGRDFDKFDVEVIK
jgi:hypothetical protein